MNAKILNIGDKIDIRLLQQVEQGDGQIAKVYKSMLEDIKQGGFLEISMPIEGGKMVLLPTGVRLEFIFYTKGGLYRCVAQVKDRYKSNNLFMLLIELKSPLEKFQRREYFRFGCVMDMEYLNITEEETKITDIERLKEQHAREYPEEGYHKAIAVDISGGGIRFVAEDEGKNGDCLLARIQLTSESVNQLLEVAGRVLSCKRLESDTKVRKYEYRIEFLMKDQKKREMVIKYIFEQERKNRQKG